MKRVLVWAAMVGLGWCQPIIPGQSLPVVPNQVPETADMREAKFLFAEGQRLHREDKVSRAIELYRKALARDPGRLEYRPYLAQALETQGMHAEALEQYNLYLAEEPQNQRVVCDRLLPLIGLSRWEELDQEFQLLEARQNQQADFWLYQGLSWLARERPEKALAPLEKAHELAPLRQDITLNLASARLLSDQPQATLDLLAALSGPRAELLKGLALYRLKKADEAEKIWKSLLATPGLFEVGLNLASSLAERGQTTEAMRLVAQILDQQPASAAARMLYARLLNRQGRYEESLMALRPLLEPGPVSSGYLCELLGWTYIGLRRDAEALPYLRQALQAGINSAALQNNLALGLARLGKLDEALSHQLKATELSPQEPSVWLHLGSLYEQQAAPGKALKAYEHFLELEPSGERADSLRARLKILRPNR